MIWDYLIIGSGFGGSVCALRLVEKGYRVVVLEKGRRLGPNEFPKTNWNLKRWFWLPQLGWRGLFKMTFFRHLTVVSGVGVGGGSLVFGNTLATPPDSFFTAESWKGLADWKQELEPHYATARHMLGASKNPLLTQTDEVIEQVAQEIGCHSGYRPTTVSVYFGEPGVTVSDPYFEGKGPDRTGCIGCGGCMLGCRFNAKNTLDKNYLYLAEKLGLVIVPDSEATWVRPKNGGYEVEVLEGTFWRRKRSYLATNVIFAGGVLGTVHLLLKLKQSPDGLPHLSDATGKYVRTNSEALIGVVCLRRNVDVSKGIAVSSIIQMDDHSTLEPVRYPSGSGFFRLLAIPHVSSDKVITRTAQLAFTVIRHPLKVLRALFVWNWAKRTLILLYMRTTEGSLSLQRGRSAFTFFRRGLVTSAQRGTVPKASMPEATDLAHRVAKKLDGLPMSLINETLLNIPTTAHILGGCCMGDSPKTSVIDHQHRVFGYDGLYVIDGSAISANPGVNPALTIVALAERAMSFIPDKHG
jgi:cholesterol oxidase